VLPVPGSSAVFGASEDISPLLPKELARSLVPGQYGGSARAAGYVSSWSASVWRDCRAQQPAIPIISSENVRQTYAS
jgi:hypothetical protein